MLSPPPPYSFEKSVFISSTQRGGRGGFRGHGGGGRGNFPDGRGGFSGDDKLKCKHCGRFQHTKDTYYLTYMVILRSFRVIILNVVLFLGGVIVYYERAQNFLV